MRTFNKHWQSRMKSRAIHSQLGQYRNTTPVVDSDGNYVLYFVFVVLFLLAILFS